MIFQRFEVPGLAHYSYLLGSNGEAVVVDPKRDVSDYLKLADEKGLRITHVLETHIHADFASGALELAAATGASLWLSAHDEGEEYEYQFEHHPYRDSDALEIGDLRILALHTPGHTPEHLSFLVFEKSRCGQPLALLSGDFIFVGSLGRPDLLGDEAKHELAGLLYESVHTKIEGLPDGTEIHPAHGAGSLCGSGMSERPQSTLGYERHCNVFMSEQPKEKFIETILRTVPPFPGYYKRMKQLNSKGAPVLEGLPGGYAFPASEFREEIRKSEAVVVDLRSPEAFGGLHIPGSLNIGAGQNLSLWSGWIVPYNRPIFLVGDTSTDLEAARKSFIRVGHDDLRGFLIGGISTWIAAGFEQEHIPQISVVELDHKLPEHPFVLDVRSPKEWSEGHIEGALHIPVGDMGAKVDKIPQGKPIHVICGSGYRSSIATSVLLRAGIAEVINVTGGMTAWNAQKLPTTQG